MFCFLKFLISVICLLFWILVIGGICAKCPKNMAKMMKMGIKGQKRLCYQSLDILCADLVEDLLGALDLGGEEGGVTLGHLLLSHPHVVTLHSQGRWLTEVSTKFRGKQYYVFRCRHSIFL